jgi:maleate isomerase
MPSPPVWVKAGQTRIIVGIAQAHAEELAMIRHFGMLIPSTNTTVEIEYSRLLPETLQLHVARLGKDGNTPFHPSLKADIDYQSKMLGNAKVEAICLTQTSASLFEDGYDADVKRRMDKGAGAPALTSAEAVGAAVRALGASRIAIATPYSEEVIGLAKRYFETRFGLETVATESFGATDSYAIGGLSADHATDAFARIDRPEIEALVVPGGNFPTMKHVAGWERQFGKPVITTNQAAIWAVMDVLKVTTPLPGLGRLLETLPTA